MKKIKTNKPKTYTVKTQNSSEGKREFVFYDEFEAWEFYHRVSSVLELMGEEWSWVAFPVTSA